MFSTGVINADILWINGADNRQGERWGGNEGKDKRILCFRLAYHVLIKMLHIWEDFRFESQHELFYSLGDKEIRGT